MEKYGMFMRKLIFIAIGTGALGLAGILTVWSAEDGGFTGVGRAASEDQIRGWNIDVSSTGQGLPAGRGTVKQGAQVFAAKCAVCHGPTGTEGPKDKLVGGRGTLASPKPVRTIGSYWPYAPTVYDYINRAMPFNAPGSLSPEEIYSVVAWLLYKNEIVPEDAVMDAQTLPQVQMPNRDGFIPDQRPDVPTK
jgi:S-disulfanyl-L-cysteine oxidoreductase SoxD